MKRIISLGFFGLLAIGSVSAQGLYYLGTETEDSIPLKWVIGTNVIYDDNVAPGYGTKEDSIGINSYMGLSFVSITPQTTWDVYVRLGLIYYASAPSTMDSINPQSRVGVNLTHRFSERLRLSSRNFISYELEPDYSYGYASSRPTGAYFFWQSDDSIGFRWSERFATYTGIRLTGTTYPDIPQNDRFTWELYNQLRYQLSIQTLLTFDARYGQTSGNGAFTDASDIYLLCGAEHRFSPNTVGLINTGVQLHSVKGGDNSASPYLEFALNSQMTEQFRIRSYARYGIETANNVQTVNAKQIEFGDVQVLRIGISSDYAISPMFSLFGGVDYIPTSYSSGHEVGTGLSYADQSSDIINTYIGLSVKFNDYLTGTASYNYTHSSSDFSSAGTGGNYDRSRVSVGLSAEF